MKSLSNFQWKILLLVVLVTIVNYIDRSSISFAIKPISAAFSIDNTKFGLISASFGIGYIIMSIYGGTLVDRFGIVGPWAIAAALWSVFTMLMGLADGFWTFFWLRICLGLAEGIHFPSLIKTVTNWLPASLRARAISICLSGVPFASIMGAPLTTNLINSFGWQVMFFILGSLGIIWALAWLILFRKHPKALFSAEHALNATTVRKKTPWKALLSNRSFLIVAFTYFAFGFTIAFALMWLPGYLQQTYSITVLSVGYLVLSPWIASAIFLLLGGWVSDHLMKRTKSIRISRSLPMAISVLFSGLSFLAIAFSHELITALIWMTLGVGIIYFFNAPVYAFIIDLFKPYAGTVQGLFSAVFSFSMIVSPAIIGWLAQSTGNFKSAFFLLAAISISTSTIQLLFHRPDKESQKFV